MNYIKVFLTSASLSMAAFVLASDGLQPIGFSVSQMAVGGAVTANPTSAITVLTNPAGLTYVPLSSEFSLVFSSPRIRAGFNAAGVESRSAKDFQLIPSVAIAAPMKNPNMRFGFAVGVVAGSGTDYSWPTLSRSAFSDLQIIRIAPGLSWKVSNKTSVGGALNLNIGRVSLANEGFGASTLPAAFGHGTETVGVGFTLGVMHEIGEKTKVGASYISRTNFPDSKYPSAAGEYRGAFNMPEQYALGVSYEATKALTFSADAKWIQYGETLSKLMIYGPGLGSGLDLGTKWRNQSVVALGAQYKLGGGFILSAGFNHCNKPFEDQYATKNLLLPAVATDHYTFGLTTEAGQNWSLGAVIVLQPTSTVSDGITTLKNSNTTFGLNATVKF